MDIVVHWTTGNEEITIGNLKAIMTDSRTGVEQAHLVSMGKAISSVVTGSTVEDDLLALIENGVEIKACMNSMKKMGIDRGELVEGVQPVESGPGELVILQDRGFNYIRP